MGRLRSGGGMHTRLGLPKYTGAALHLLAPNAATPLNIKKNLTIGGTGPTHNDTPAQQTGCPPGTPASMLTPRDNRTVV